MAQRLALLLASVLLLAPVLTAQSVGNKTGGDELTVEKVVLLSDLQGMEAKAGQLDKPVARALALAEIADAAWGLDKAWSQKLLRASFEMTFPAEEERNRLRDRPAGTAPSVPTEVDRALNAVRNRVLGVASRDKVFADELAQISAREMGRQEESSRYSNLAAKSLAEGDKTAAGTYLLQAIEADPTQITASFTLVNLAARDRKAADEVILQYIERLRTIPLSAANGSAARAYFSLRNVVFTNESFDPKYRNIPPAGPTVIRAFISYVIESMAGLEQREPGSLIGLRGTLISFWLPLNRYAPELAPAFLELEKLSRRPDGSTSLPTSGVQEAGKARYEEQVKRALDGGKADELTINLAIGQEDFAAARKMIDTLPEGEQKSRLVEEVNTREATSLAAKDDIDGAERLARQLNKATSILQAYTAIIGRCAAKKNATCAATLGYEATKQLKRSKDEATLPLSLSRLARVVAPLDTSMALEMLDEAVLAANKSDADAGLGDIGLDIAAFKGLAPKSELRVHQAALNLKDPFRQVVVLAAIYQWKAEEFTKKAKAAAGSDDGDPRH